MLLMHSETQRRKYEIIFFLDCRCKNCHFSIEEQKYFQITLLGTGHVLCRDRRTLRHICKNSVATNIRQYAI